MSVTQAMRVAMPIPSKPIPEFTPAQLSRLAGYILKTEGCWFWTGSISGNSTHKYGDFYVNYTHFRAHRVLYSLHKGAIPHGYVIDHICRNTFCVNPDHLDAVTQHENTLRGLSYPTHCKSGHPFSGNNLRVEGMRRRCKKCGALKSLKYRKRKALQNA